MTNYRVWDKKATDLVREADEDCQKAKRECDVALGLQDGPQGPPTQRSMQQRSEMCGHSNSRRNFIAEQQAREVTLDHKGAVEPVVISSEQAGGRAVRLQGCCDVVYEVPKGVHLLKLFIDRCQNVQVHLRHPLMTSTVEISHCSGVELHTNQPLATVQCDECAAQPVRIIFAEPEHLGTFFHQNAPALEVAIDGQDLATIGVAELRQFVTRPGPQQGSFVTEEVIRGESEYPLNAGPASIAHAAPREAESEQCARAEAKRVEGNEAFRANDFLQAAVFYTEAIRLCPDLHLAWANRAQCFLQTGQAEKALEDAMRCTELAPEYAKGWFRKGIALHALQRYGEAIPAFSQAERLDPKNSQIPESIKMAQLMCRKHGYSTSP